MSDAAVQFSLTGEEILTVHLNGEWRMETDAPSTEPMMEQLDRHPSIKRMVFDADGARFMGQQPSDLLF